MTEPSPSLSPTSLGRLADLALFAPIGLVCRLRDEVPHLAEAGRARVEGQLRLARVIGEMAVKQGRREVVRRLDEVAEQRRLPSAPLVVEALLREEPAVEVAAVELPAVEMPAVELLALELPPVEKQAVEPRPVKKQAAKKQAAKKPVVAKPAVTKQAVEKPVVETQVARATATTAPAPPAAPPVDAASLPISDYDSLAASQVVARLVALGPDDLTAIGSYEAATRGRRTILGKVQQLQAR